MLDGLGVDYVEGGYPGANPTDTALFSREARRQIATFTAFGMTKRAGRSASNDPGLAATARRQGRRHLFRRQELGLSGAGRARDHHSRKTSTAIRDSVAAAKAAGREVMLDCEHFFDGYKANPDYALACAKAAYDAGARWVVLCDTNGGTLPHEVEEIVARGGDKSSPAIALGIHAHNDTEQAVANSLAAVRAGARQIQGTLERGRRALRQRQPRARSSRR